MVLTIPRTSRIASIASYLPDIEVPNDALRARFESSSPGFVDKMQARTGIHTRWLAPPDWSTSDVALPACVEALRRAGRRPEDVDLIVLGTDSPDYITPATSVVLQHKLGATGAGTFDVGCACASFPTALAVAHGLIATNPGLRTVLVVGVYRMSKLSDPNDPMVFFYGDGAGAAVVEPASEPGILGFAAQADGSLADAWGIYAGGTVEPASIEAISAGRTQVRVARRYPPEVNDEGWPRLARRLATQLDFALEDVNLFIFTQVRRPTIELVMKSLDLPVDRAHTIMQHSGYTGSACIPMAYADACDRGKVNAGDLVVLIGSGVGYNQAAVAFRA